MFALQGTVIDLLDEFEAKVMKKYPFHRYTLTNQKNADVQVPGPAPHCHPCGKARAQDVEKSKKSRKKSELLVVHSVIKTSGLCGCG